MLPRAAVTGRRGLLDGPHAAPLSARHTSSAPRARWQRPPLPSIHVSLSLLISVLCLSLPLVVPSTFPLHVAAQHRNTIKEYRRAKSNESEDNLVYLIHGADASIKAGKEVSTKMMKKLMKDYKQQRGVLSHNIGEKVRHAHERCPRFGSRPDAPCFVLGWWRPGCC